MQFSIQKLLCSQKHPDSKHIKAYNKMARVLVEYELFGIERYDLVETTVAGLNVHCW
jgi:hypothetical protein